VVEAEANVERPVKVGVAMVGEVALTTSPVPVQVKRDEVAIADGTAEAPVILPRTELAAIEARPRLTFAPPTWYPSVPEETESPFETAIVDVATFANVFAPEKYGMFPTTATVDVESPSKPTVAPERVTGHEADIVACLLLNVVQSVPERSPRTAAVAVGRLNVNVPLLFVMPQSLLIAVVEVANVSAPVCAVPYVCPREMTPVLVTLPLEYERPEEKVVVAVHVGTPFKRARMFPAVPAVVVERAEEPLPYGITPVAMLAQPVPPFATGRIPVTSLARLTRAVDRAPAVALRKPERDVDTVARLGALVSVPIVEVALIRASALASV